MEIKALWTIEEQTLLTQAICYKFAYSDTRTEIKETEIENEVPVFDEEWNQTWTKIETTIQKENITVPNISPQDFATLKIWEYLDWIVSEYNSYLASVKRAEAISKIDAEIQSEVDSNKINITV
jgi:hypothetical protein